MSTAELDYLRARVEQYKEDERARSDEELDRYLREKKEREEEQQRNERVADDWPEAFSKNDTLFRRELAECKAEFPEGIPWWEGAIAANNRARELYTEGWARIEAELAQKRKDLLVAIAERLGAEYPKDSDGLIGPLRADDPCGYLEW